MSPINMSHDSYFNKKNPCFQLNDIEGQKVKGHLPVNWVPGGHFRYRSQ